MFLETPLETFTNVHKFEETVESNTKEQRNSGYTTWAGQKKYIINGCF